MKLSSFGRNLTTDSSILNVMDDLGRALAGGDHIAMFGGGNPAEIPAMQELFKERLLELAGDPEQLASLISRYDTPQGNALFIKAIVKLLNDTYHWGITPEHVAVTPGSQTGYFSLFNLLAGPGEHGHRKVLLPLVPEYCGYADQGAHPDMFEARRPIIELHGERSFKYRIDFDNLKLTDDHAAICLSRPTNPTGNVVTDEEVRHLAALAKANDIPLIIDNAYGLPFPGVVFRETNPIWNDHIIYSMSLSKVGLPSSRVGIFVARPDIASAIAKANAIMSLASPSFGQVLAAPLIADGSLVTATRKHVKPFYEQAAVYARGVIEQHFQGITYRLHEHEGAYFFWLWLEGLPISSRELYTRLKDRGVITVPGEYFFPGLDEPDWAHQRECLRLNFARPKAEIDAGFPVMAEVIKAAYAKP